MPDVSLLDDAAQYSSCDGDSVGSVALVNTTFNTATVAYYTGTTPGSRACFVCDEDSGYELNKVTAERNCQLMEHGPEVPSHVVCRNFGAFTVSAGKFMTVEYYIIVHCAKMKPRFLTCFCMEYYE